MTADPFHTVEGSGARAIYFGRDQSAYVWFLAWGAHAFTHLENLFLTTQVFAPHGYNLAWTASIPGPSLLLAPLTEAIGAIATFNLLALAAPATAALCAFLLCRQITGRVSSAFAGGLLFGFGTYETGETINHVNLALVALLPLALLLALRRHGGEISRARFVTALGLLFGAQLWTSAEVFATMVFFGVLALSLALLLAPSRDRPAVAKLVPEVLLALLMGLLIGLPYLYYAVRYPNPLGDHSQYPYGADLANFVVPTRATWLHGPRGVAEAAADLSGNLTEQLSYMGPALLGLLLAFAAAFARQFAGRLIIVFMLAVGLVSLGGHLVVGGHATGIALPWQAIGQLPFLRYATPGRFAVYLWLAAAVATALWLDGGRLRYLRWSLFAAVAVSLAPNLTGLPWASHVDAPGLMTNRALVRRIPEGSTVIALPFGEKGNSMYWQVEARFRYRLAGGYVSWAIPASYRRQTILHELIGGKPRRAELQRLCAFIAYTHAQLIALREHTPGFWGLSLAPLRVLPQHVGGFALYPIAGIRTPGHACAASS